VGHCWIGFTGCLTTSNIQVSRVSKGRYFALHSHIDCFTLVYIYIYVCWGGITTPILLLILLSRLSRSAGYARDVEVLMRSTVSTCPRVGARCYPHFLGITRRSCLEAHRS
jgi:hypothetical protein